MRQRKSLFFTLFLLTFLLMPNASGQERIVCDETCEIGADSKSAATSGTVGYAVVSPVGRGTVEPIRQAPRLSTLNGKTIAVVGVSFMSRVTHPEIKRLIERHYPEAKVLLLDEVGTAGPYPAPGITRRAKDEFQQRLRELGVDAVISGNGGCGLCTPKEVGSCLAAEHIGIPSVIICAPGFTRQARYTALNNGVPVMRIAEYPGAFALDTEEVLLKNTQEVLWPQIVDALTQPITAEETASALKESRGDLRDDVFFGTLEEINNYFTDMKWTDGLPIIPPTFERVSEMMRFTDDPWDATVAVLPIAQRNTTAWHVAVNGMMAGCKPEWMPVLIALTKALGGPDFRRTHPRTALSFDRRPGEISHRGITTPAQGTCLRQLLCEPWRGEGRRRAQPETVHGTSEAHRGGSNDRNTRMARQSQRLCRDRSHHAAGHDAVYHHG